MSYVYIFPTIMLYYRNQEIVSRKILYLIPDTFLVILYTGYFCAVQKHCFQYTLRQHKNEVWCIN